MYACACLRESLCVRACGLTVSGVVDLVMGVVQGDVGGWVGGWLGGWVF